MRGWYKNLVCFLLQDSISDHDQSSCITPIVLLNRVFGYPQLTVKKRIFSPLTDSVIVENLS